MLTNKKANTRILRIALGICLLLVCISAGAQGSPPDFTRLESPRDAIENHLFYLQEDSRDPAKAARSIGGTESEEIRIRKAIRLKKILDAGGHYIDLNLLPSDPQYFDSSRQAAIYHLDPIDLPKVYVERIDGKWRYSRSTVEAIDRLFDETFLFGSELLIELLPEHLGTRTTLGLKNWQWTGIGLLLLLAILLQRLISAFVKFLLNLVIRTRLKVVITDEDRARNTARLISLIMVFSLLYWSFPSLMLPVKAAQWTRLFLEIFLVVFITFALLSLVRLFAYHAGRLSEKTESKMDDQLIPLVQKSINAFIVIIGGAIVLERLGVNLTALIAGVSISGLAVAFAAQDTVKNFLGSLTIFLDKPFQIGDWIVVGEVDGIVEEVGFRATRVRTFSDSVVYLPNGQLANRFINNMGIRNLRRFKTDIGVKYDTPPDLIETFVEGLRQIVKRHPATTNSKLEISLNSFGDSSLNILFYIFFEVPGWSDELQARQEVMLEILRLAEALGVEIAFPTQTLQIESIPGQPSAAGQYDSYKSSVQSRLDAYYGQLDARIASEYRKS